MCRQHTLLSHIPRENRGGRERGKGGTGKREGRQGEREGAGREGREAEPLPRRPRSGMLLGKEDIQDLGALSQTQRVPPQNNIAHPRSVPRESGVNGVSHLSC